MRKSISTAAALAATALFAGAAQAEVANSFMRAAIDHGARVVAISKDQIITCKANDSAPYQSCLRATYHFQTDASGGQSHVYRCDVVSAPSSKGDSVIVDEACSQIL